MHRLLNAILPIEQQLSYHGCIQPNNLYIHQGMIKIGEPFIVTQSTETKLNDKRMILDYFAPEFKEDPR